MSGLLNKIKKGKVIIFSKSYCSPCKKAKETL